MRLRAHCSPEATAPPRFSLINIIKEARTNRPDRSQSDRIKFDESKQKGELIEGLVRLCFCRNVLCRFYILNVTDWFWNLQAVFTHPA